LLTIKVKVIFLNLSCIVKFIIAFSLSVIIQGCYQTLTGENLLSGVVIIYLI